MFNSDFDGDVVEYNRGPDDWSSAGQNFRTQRGGIHRPTPMPVPVQDVKEIGERNQILLSYAKRKKTKPSLFEMFWIL